MRSIAAFVRKTALGGVLFLLPVALVIFLLGHLFSTVRPIAAEAASFLGQSGVGPFWLTAATVVGLVAAAFLAGLLAMTAAGQSLIEQIETFVLNRLPGYGLLKSTAADVAGSVGEMDASQRKKVVLVGGGDGWQLGFVMGEIRERHCAVFVPEAPSAASGAVIFLAKEQLVETGITPSDALACLRRLGARPPDLSVLVPAPSGTGNA